MGGKARPAHDDARSESSFVNAKDRVTSLTATSKSKKLNAHLLNNVSSSSKTASAAMTATLGTSDKQNATIESEIEAPHIDWSTMSTTSLHSYRSAYRLQIPPSYTQSHADLLYNSCDLALRAPSQILARRRAHDLKTYRRKQSQLTSTNRTAVNGISKSSRGSRVKEKDRDGNADTSSRDGRRRTNNGKAKDTADTSSMHLTVDAPPSPTSHPSNQDSLSNPTDNASRTSRLTPLETQQQQQEQEDSDNANSIPNTLNQNDPEATILGFQSPGSLATSIRKHFNAQQLNEAETIARFTYVVRQQGSNVSSRILPLAHRLPKGGPAIMLGGSGLAGTEMAAPGSIGATAASSSSRQHVNSALTTTPANTLGGNHVQAEGSWGDGTGWIISTTSCGRQVRMPGEGGGGTFRLRFRP